MVRQTNRHNFILEKRLVIVNLEKKNRVIKISFMKTNCSCKQYGKMQGSATANEIRKAANLNTSSPSLYHYKIIKRL